MNTRIVVNGSTLVAGKEKPVELQRQIDELTRSLAEQQVNQSATEAIGGTDGTAVQVTTSQQFVINGRSYKSLEEMPPADRKLFEQMRGLLVDQALGKGSATAANAPGPPNSSHTASIEPIISFTAPTFLLPNQEDSDLAWLGPFFLLLLGISIGLAIAVALWFALK